MGNDNDAVNEEARYWNEEGGQRWVEYIDRIEPMLDRFSAQLIKAVNAQTGEHVLDIGCGGGPTSAIYAAHVGPQGRVLGVDISDIILKLARQRHGGAEQLHFESADAATYAFEPASFDVITSRYGVMFFPEPDAAFSNIRRAAKPGARLRLMVWRPLDENPWMGLPARAAFSVIPAPEKAPPGTPGPFSLADPERLRALLTGAGFTAIEMSPIDELIALGPVNDALDWLTKMGPAARPLSAASAPERDAACAAMRQVLVEHDSDDGVTFPGAAWLISADVP